MDNDPFKTEVAICRTLCHTHSRMLLLHNALKQIFLKLLLGLVKPELKYLHALVQCFGATDVQTTTLIFTNLTITF